MEAQTREHAREDKIAPQEHKRQSLEEVVGGPVREAVPARASLPRRLRQRGEGVGRPVVEVGEGGVRVAQTRVRGAGARPRGGEGGVRDAQKAFREDDIGGGGEGDAEL